MYTNPKMKYKGDLSRDKPKWTKTCRQKPIEVEGC